MLRIYLLGDFRVLWEERLLPPFPTRPARSLFAYLVTNRQRAHSRSQLAGLFWGDFPETRAHRNLNTTIWRLRHTLPDGYLLSEGDTIAFDTAKGYWLDVDAFEACCSVHGVTLAEQSHALEEAIRLYRGDFLAGCFEDWALVEAERLRLLYIRALHDLVNCYQASGSYSQALNTAHRLLGIDPLHEDIHRRVMELHAVLGQREAALAQFSVCQRILQDEMGIPPAPETVTVYEQIRSGIWAGFSTKAETGAVVGGGFRTPFDDSSPIAMVGREVGLAFFQSRLAGLRTDGGGMILLEGEAGVGKTRLVREVTRQAESLGIIVLWGACTDLEVPPPYQCWIEALRSSLTSLKREDFLPISSIWLAELSPLLPELPSQPLSSGREQGRLLEAIYHYLEGLARLGPYLIILEDIQWSDPATLEVLQYVLPRLRELPILLVVTLRAEEASDRIELVEALSVLDSTGMFHRLSLTRLSPDEAGLMVSRVLGGVEDTSALSRYVYKETEGNPFFIGEVLKLLVEEGHIRLRADGRWETPWDGQVVQPEVAMHLPQGIRQALQRRLVTLTPASRCMLEAAAVLGRDFDVDLLRQVCQQDEEIALESTNDLLRRRLLVEEDDRLAFSHDKIRQVVYKGLSPVRRQALHRQAGMVLAQFTPQRVEELANHCYLAQDYGRALPYCLQAGKRAASLYANRSALMDFGWAIDAARYIGGDEGWRALVTAYEQRGQVWAHLGNYDEALTDYDSMRRAATACGDLSGIARAVRRSGWIHGDCLGERELGMKETLQALEMARKAGDRHEEAQALLNIGAFHNMNSQHAESVRSHQDALALFRELGDRPGEASSLQYIAVNYHFQGQFEQSLAAYRQSFEIWQELGECRNASKTQTNIGYLALSMGDLATAETAFRQAEATLREIEAMPALPWVLIGIGAVLRSLCQYQASLETLEEAADLEQQSSCNPYVRGLIEHHRGAAYWESGDQKAAIRHLEESLSLARQSETPTLVMGTLSLLGRYLRQIGELDRAGHLHQELLDLARKAGSATIEASALSELGLDQTLRGRMNEGMADLEKAVEQSRTSVDARGRAEILLNLAEGRLATGQAENALPVIQEGISLAGYAGGNNELEAWGYLLKGRALLALERPGEAKEALQRGLDCLDPAGKSLTHMALAEALGNL